MSNKMKQLSSAPRAVSGVTLVELLIAVAIVGILAAIAYPSYQNQVMRTHRNAAKACLTEAAQFMERYYTTNLTYVGANPLPAIGCDTDGNMGLRYNFAADNLAQGTFTVTATPIDAQLARDTECAVLSIDQTGDRDATGTGGPARCW